MPETMSGGCHCGRVRFRVTAELSRVTECNCSICTKKGFLHLIVAPEQFELLSGADALTTYRFNTGTAQAHLLRDLRHSCLFTCRARIPTRSTSMSAASTTSILRRSSRIPFDGQHWEHAIAERVPWR